MSGRARRWLAVLAALSIATAGAWLSAQEADHLPRALLFRRVFVPEEHLAKVVNDHVPMRRDEFHEKLALIESQGRRGPGGSASRVVSAQYEARLLGDSLIDGKATLEIEHDDTAPDGLMSLDPLRLAVTDAVWRDGADSRPAIIGLDGAGQIAVPVERSGELELTWTLHGQRSESGRIEFSLVLPPSPSNQLVLALPAGLTPRCADAVIIPEQAEQPAEVEEGEDPPQRRWRLELGGTHQTRVTVVPEEVRRNRRQLVLLRQSAVYAIAPSALELQMELHLDVFHEPLRQLELEVHPDLQITGARFGDTSVTWVAQPGEEGANSTILLDFEPPLQGTGRVVRLAAIAPVTLGELWQLPKLRVKNVIWQEGTTILQLDESLALQDVRTAQSRASRVTSAAGGSETIQLQNFSPEASVSTYIIHRAPELEVRAGTTIKVEAGVMQASYVADIASRWGEVFDLELSVPRSWFVGSVESVPSGAVKDFVVEDGGGPQRLRVRLNRAVDPAADLVLQVRGQRRVPRSTDPLQLRQLKFASLRDVLPAEHLISINAKPPHHLQLIGDMEVQRLTASELTVDQRALVEAAVGDLIFLDSAAAESALLHITSEQPRFAAEIDVRATVDGGVLIENYRIQCTPGTSYVRRLLVQLSQARRDLLVWSLEGDADRPLTARLRRSTSSASPAAAEDSAKATEDETWEIDLDRPRNEPFTITGRRVSPFGERLALSLASLSEASTQSAVLAIESRGGESVAIEHQGVKPIPAADDADRSAVLRAAYRYQPLQDAQVWVEHEPQVQPALRGACIWSAGIHSWFARSGRGSHWAVYCLENAGLSTMSVQLPAGTRVERAHVNDAEVLPLQRGESFNIPLPPDQRYLVIRIRYASDQPPLQFADAVEAPLPRPDLPVFDQQWTVWLPPDFSSRSYGQRGEPALSWQERLFGPLARAGGRPFRFFSRSDWQTLFGRRSAGSPTQYEAAFDESLGSVLQDPSVTSWGALWNGYQQSHQAAGDLPPLLVDAAALNALAITPATPLREDDERPARIWHLLERAGLAILMHPEAMLLTTRSFASVQDSRSDLFGESALYYSDDRLLARWFSETDSPRWEFVPLAVWLEAAPSATSPWPLSQRTGMAEETAGGSWSAFRRPVTRDAFDSATLHLDVYQPRAWQTFGWAFFLTVAGCVAWWGSGRWTIVGLLAAALALAALVLPAVYAPPATGAFLGTLFGAGLAIVGGRLPERRPATGSAFSTRYRVPAHAGLLLAVLLVGIATVVSRAQQVETQHAPAGASRLVHQVLIPVDKERQPVGSYVHLKRAFYDEIHRRAAEAENSQRGYLVHRATYKTRLQGTSPGLPLQAGELEAQYEIEVFEPGTRVQLTLAREDAQVVQARLNGQPIAIGWDRSDELLSFDADRSGSLSLQLTLRPAVRARADVAAIEMDIPRVPFSKVELVTPIDASDVEFLTAVGDSQRDTALGQWDVDLGPAENLVIQWPTAASPAVPRPDLYVEQLLWLKVQPSTVVVETQFNFSVPEGTIEEVELHVDPRLRLLPLRADVPVVGEPEIEDGEVKKIRLTLAPGIGRQFRLPATFHLGATTGIGNVSLPRVDAVADHTDRRWLGVSVASTLEYEPAEGLESLSSAEFFAAWGEAAAVPELTFRLPVEPVMWSLATRPRSSIATIDQDLHVSIGNRGVDLYYTAQADAGAVSRLQYRLHVPDDIRVRHVSLLDNGVERVRRWALGDSGVLTVFLNDSVTGPQELFVEATLPRERSDDMALPRITLEESNVRSDRYYVYRRPDVAVEVQSLDGLSSVSGAPVGQYREGLGRLVASLERLGDTPDAHIAQALLSVVPNEPEANAWQVTEVRREQDNWLVEVTYEVNVSRGIVDSLRWEIPAEWVEPFTFHPLVDNEIIRAPAENKRQLIVRPSTAITNQYRVTIRGSLTATPPRVPDVAPLDTEHVERFVVVPAQLDQRQIDWETSGLRNEPLPTEVAEQIAIAADSTVYRVVGPHSQARIKEVAPMSGTALLRLVDVHLAVTNDDHAQGIAIFDLEPAGRAECVLIAPPEWEVLQIWVGGQPAVATVLSDRQWRVHLASEQLPQRIEVAFRQVAESGTELQTLKTPYLHRIPVRRTHWTLYADSQSHDVQLIAERGEAEAFEQELERLGATAELIAAGSSGVTEAAAQEVLDWYSSWSARLAASRDRLLYYQLLAGRIDALDRRKVERIESQQAQIAERIFASVLPDDGVSPASATELSAVQRWRLSRSWPARITRYAFDNAMPVVAARPVPWAAGDGFGRLLACIAVAVLTLGTWVTARWSLFADLVHRWPQLLGVAAGLAWWLLLEPSLLGWFIIGGSLASALWPRWGEKYAR